MKNEEIIYIILISKSTSNSSKLNSGHYSSLYSELAKKFRKRLSRSILKKNQLKHINRLFVN